MEHGEKNKIKFIGQRHFFFHLWKGKTRKDSKILRWENKAGE